MPSDLGHAGSGGEHRDRRKTDPHRGVPVCAPDLEADEGPSAKPKAGVEPNAPMYAPRMSAGASAATTACEVGTQSISPITKTTRITAITETASDTDCHAAGTEHADRVPSVS